MAIKILFRGLFCHFTNTNTVVIIDAFQHNLRLVARTADVAASAGFASDMIFAKKDEKSFKVGGHVLKLGGTTPGATTRSADFVSRVPGLTAHTTCTQVRPMVAARQLVSHIAGYLVHEGGAYSVHDFFPDMVTFTGNGANASCIARTVALDVQSAGDVTIGDGPASVTIRNGSTVSFMNAIDATLGLPNEHFHHYYHAIFDGCPGGQQPRAVVGHPCPQAPPPDAFPGADCANSHNP